MIKHLKNQNNKKGKNNLQEMEKKFQAIQAKVVIVKYLKTLIKTRKNILLTLKKRHINTNLKDKRKHLKKLSINLKIL
jgi:hypothetical protein